MASDGRIPNHIENLAAKCEWLQTLSGRVLGLQLQERELRPRSQRAPNASVIEMFA